jgi:hypothetical protein
MASNQPPPSPRPADASPTPGPLQSGARTERSAAGVGTSPAAPLSPRILIVMRDQWPRATLRAALREVGYDAIGTRSLPGALAYPAHVAGRGPVRAIVVDGSAVSPSAVTQQIGEELAALLQRYGAVPLLLLASAVHADPPGAWTRVVRRPFSIQEVVQTISDMVPLASELRRPIDTK